MKKLIERINKVAIHLDGLGISSDFEELKSINKDLKEFYERLDINFFWDKNPLIIHKKCGLDIDLCQCPDAEIKPIDFDKESGDL